MHTRRAEFPCEKYAPREGKSVHGQTGINPLSSQTNNFSEEPVAGTAAEMAYQETLFTVQNDDGVDAWTSTFSMLVDMFTDTSSNPDRVRLQERSKPGNFVFRCVKQSRGEFHYARLSLHAARKVGGRRVCTSRRHVPKKARQPREPSNMSVLCALANVWERRANRWKAEREDDEYFLAQEGPQCCTAPQTLPPQGVVLFNGNRKLQRRISSKDVTSRACHSQCGPSSKAEHDGHQLATGDTGMEKDEPIVELYSARARIWRGYLNTESEAQLCGVCSCIARQLRVLPRDLKYAVGWFCSTNLAASVAKARLHNGIVTVVVHRRVSRLTAIRCFRAWAGLCDVAPELVASSSEDEYGGHACAGDARHEETSDSECEHWCHGLCGCKFWEKLQLKPSRPVLSSALSARPSCSKQETKSKIRKEPSIRGGGKLPPQAQELRTDRTGFEPNSLLQKTVTRRGNVWRVGDKE